MNQGISSKSVIEMHYSVCCLYSSYNVDAFLFVSLCHKLQLHHEFVAAFASVTVSPHKLMASGWCRL